MALFRLRLLLTFPMGKRGEDVKGFTGSRSLSDKDDSGPSGVPLMTKRDGVQIILDVSCAVNDEDSVYGGTMDER